jgi:hypothetical protein
VAGAHAASTMLESNTIAIKRYKTFDFFILSPSPQNMEIA